jgi:MFS transporter, DHA1 family, tetracycline resistance protein
MPAEEAARSKRALTFLFLTVFIDLLGVGLLVPVMPYLVRRYDSDALTVGLLSASFAMAQFLASPLLGLWSDRAGRRPVLLISLFGTGVGYYLFGIGGSLAVLFTARVIDGFTGGNFSIAQAYIADGTEAHDRTKAFGLIGAAVGMGVVLGPALSGLLAHISISAPAYAAGTLALANTLFGYFALPESLPPEKRKKGPLRWRDLDPLLPMMKYLRRPVVGLMLWAVFAFSFAHSGLQSNFAVYTLNKFHWGPQDNAWMFVYLGVSSAVVQGWLLRKLAPRFGEKRLVVWGTLITGAGFATLAWSPEPFWLFVGLTLTVVGSGSGPAMQSLISQRADVNEQGTLLGVVQSVGSLTRILGPVWAGFAFDHFGMGSPYWSGAVVIVIAWLLVWSALRSTTS